ncbi:MAG: hypothetical protein IT447_08480 [Phycisphaerales bacterium]|jgi:hypothetical protein|nr:hypothetical protein [Phycisphaerales bacterium]
MPQESTKDRIRQVLLQDWDPSNAARFESARGEYDSYIDPLLELIGQGADEERVVRFLHERELESMCFPPAGSSHLHRVARRLIKAAGVKSQS